MKVNMNFIQVKKALQKNYIRIRRLLDLREDFDENGAKEAILSNLEFKSGNAWSLIFAILVASVGLHVNSTAVIIGAMLISPLMGPIVGAGFSLAIHDFDVMKKSLLNLSYAVGISILTSTIFFLLSPTSQAQSELISRTQPNFYDVLIAILGGATGIIANTRKNKSTAIQGVAIATALMPPLCTVGYGIASMNPIYSIGALYLFLINTAFIFVSTYVFVRILKFETFKDKDPKRDRYIHKWMSIASFLIILPSIFMVWYLQKKTNFETKTQSFLDNEIATSKIIVGKPNVIFGLNQSSIIFKVFGDKFSENEIEDLKYLLKNKYKLDNIYIVADNVSKDDFTEKDLEQKFLTKQEYLNLELLKSKENKELLISAVLELNKNLPKTKFKSRFSVQILEDGKDLSIGLKWARKPSLREIDNAETFVASSLLKIKYSITHL